LVIDLLLKTVIVKTVILNFKGVLCKQYRPWRQKNHFGQLIEAAQRQPVTVTKQGRPAIVVMSTHDFESYQKQAGYRLLDVMSRMQSQAKESGLTEEALEGLLADES
jgi:prevent-host-death family protein